MLQELRSKIKKNWGFFLFSLLSLFSLARLLAQKVPGHYRIFTGAGKSLWSGLNPHGTDFGTGVGNWYYSPSCGLFFFGPISALPEKAGLILYMALSWAIFVIGVLSFSSALLKTSSKELWKSHTMNIFWVAILPQMFTAILASKLEIVMTGLLLLASSWIISSRQIIGAAFVLAMITNWKFQPLPSIGLLILLWITLKLGAVFAVYFFIFLAFWFIIPSAFLSKESFKSIYFDWNQGLSTFVRNAWKDFDNIFSFLQNFIGLQLNFNQTQIISIVAGIVIASVLLFLLILRKNKIPIHDVLREFVGFALAMGAGYTVVFSPLSQNNSYILYSPLLLMCSFVSFQTVQNKKLQLLKLAMLSCWMVMTFAYSDFISSSARALLRHWSIKPAACLCLMLCLGLYYYKSKDEAGFLFNDHS